MIASIFFLILFVTAIDTQDFYSRARNFSVEIIQYTQIKTNGNVVLAPFSLWSLLTQVAYSSIGRTRQELRGILILFRTVEDSFFKDLRNFTDLLEEESDGAKLVTKYYCFRDHTLELSSDFVTRVRRLNGNVWSLDFKDITAPRLMNSIIKTSLKTSIPIFGASDFEESEIILSNVFTFKGTWSSPFNTSNTILETSYDGIGRPIDSVNVMKQDTKVPHSHIKQLRATVTELPFGTAGKYCMLILKPDEGVTATEVYNQLAVVLFKDIFDQLQSDFTKLEKDITIKLPRFEMESFIVLNAPLNDMGIYNAFSPENAQFLHPSLDQLYIGAVEQRTKITVTEDGVDAFSTIPANLEIATKTKSFTAQPFIFFIVNKSTLTIVMGGVYGRS